MKNDLLSWATALPILLAVGSLGIWAGLTQDSEILTGAGLVLVGMWSGTAVAELFVVMARPTDRYLRASSSDTDEGDADG
jgi:hypothetical protein